MTMPEERSIHEARTSSRSSADRFTAAFVLVTSLFFMWALAHNLNDILIKQFESALSLSRSEASFIQVSFYFAYFLFALPAGHAMKRFGIKRTILLGLGLYALGAAAFYPAADIGTFLPFLVALFVIASGIVCLEIAAGAFIVLAGSAARAAFRINLAQAFNGLGAIVSPLIGGAFILAGNDPGAGSKPLPPATAAQMHANQLHQVQLPYLAIALTALALFVLLSFTRFPTVATRRHVEAGSYRALFRQWQFVAAAVGQFFYVGAQVTVWSFFIDFVKEAQPGTTDRSAAYLLSVSLFLFTFGRFAGSLLMRRISPATVLAAFGVFACCALVGAVACPGSMSVACLILISLFMSIMYPTLFAIGVNASGAQGEIGASVLVMTIVGGAVIPAGFGLIADHVGIRLGYLAIVVCFVVVTTVGLLTRGAHGDERPRDTTFH